MKDPTSPHEALADLRGATACILDMQLESGAIPWFDDGPWDPWNHAECAMALYVMGEWQAADRALKYLETTQESDGSWLGEYGSLLPMADDVRVKREKAPSFHDTNFAAYCAVAVWRRYRLTEDATTLRSQWPMVHAAIEFVLAQQHASGDVSFSSEVHGRDGDDSLRAGNASIYKSLECAILVAEVVGERKPHWIEAKARIRRALLDDPARFDRREDRSMFAMDWYYPVLAGVLPRAAATQRLLTGARHFIKFGSGCRCVSHQPWVTVAESCELAMAFAGIGAYWASARLLRTQRSYRNGRGAYWMGWQFEENVVWPEETPTWTQAAAILATDVLHRATPGWDVLTPRLTATEDAQAARRSDLFEQP